MNPSMKKNAVLMVTKTLLSLIVPLVTFPYISRVLEVEAIGQFNFASSIISYFLLLSSLGISTYAIREGAVIREDRETISEFSSEMYLLNWIATVFAFILLLLLSFFISKVRNYRILLLILSFQIMFTTFGRSWIYNVFEEFLYITVVQVLFQAISVVSLFQFVHTPEDLNTYAVINVISATGSNLLYGWHTKKYVDIHKVCLSSLKRHLKPILFIFSTSIATTIYVNSDMTILGWIVDDRSVGLYSTAVKIYNIIKQVLFAVITVSIPRLTLLAKSDAFKVLFARVFNMLLFMTLPAVTGLFLLSEEVISTIASEIYLPAAPALKWLCIALIFALVACLFGMGVLLPYGKERIFFLSTSVSAVVNVIANFALIPEFKQNAAAFTTALSQFIAFLICFSYSRKYMNRKLSYKSITCTIWGCVGIVVTCIFIKKMEFTLVVEVLLCIIVSCLVYFIINLIMKNSALSETMDALIKKLRKK